MIGMANARAVSGRVTALHPTEDSGRPGRIYPYSPLINAERNNNVFARDLHARDTLLLAAYPNRAVFLLKPEDTGVASLLRFHPVSVDSLYRTWGLDSPW